MAMFLKIVSVLYLAFVWLAFFLAFKEINPLQPMMATDEAKIIAFLIAVGLSIPAAVLYAFGQLVGDMRTTRNYARLQNEHLKAMRSYYETQRTAGR